MKKVVLFLLVALCFLAHGSEVRSAEYNIIITNLTDASIYDLVVNYGAETFKIKEIESVAFKMRNFVDYKIPKTVTFEWKDAKGKFHKKEAKMPGHNSEMGLFFKIEDGNSISIEWK